MAASAEESAMEDDKSKAVEDFRQELDISGNFSGEKYWKSKMEAYEHWRWKTEAYEYSKSKIKSRSGARMAEEQLKWRMEASGEGEKMENLWKAETTGGGGLLEEEMENERQSEGGEGAAIDEEERKLPHLRVPQPEDFDTEALERL